MTKLPALPGNVGRPTNYTKELGEAICDALMERDEFHKPRSLRLVCMIPGMPAERTVYRWLREHDEFRQGYAHAREAQSHMIAEHVVEIPYIVGDNQRARNIQDAMKWYSGKLNGKYGKGEVDTGPADLAHEEWLSLIEESSNEEEKHIYMDIDGQEKATAAAE